ncbi:hypothetical protein [Streptomyces sp. NPDC091268]|uniref:hypothetical protein n=1 Tax=Streptomyces sp. NPDC091268 TaxID=3365979 RepID=UPI00380487F3
MKITIYGWSTRQTGLAGSAAPASAEVPDTAVLSSPNGSPLATAGEHRRREPGGVFAVRGANDPVAARP